MTDDSLRAYIERFGLVLSGMGLQPMAARTLALFVCTDAETLSGGEIADALGVSPAAVSGAISLLVGAGLVERAAAPGSRRRRFRLAGDAWAGAGAVKREVFVAFTELARDGLGVVTPGGPAAARLAEMRDFYAFLAAELPALLARWSERRT